MKKSFGITFVLFLISFVINAQKFEITPQYGYQIGSKYNYNGGYLKLDDSSQYGLTLDVSLSNDMQAEFYWAQQNTSLRIKDVILYPKEEELTEVVINHYQIGAIQKFGSNDVLPFIGISAGWSTFNPEEERFSSLTTFTMGLTGGMKYFLTDNIGFRLQSQLLMPINWGGIYVGGGGAGVSAGGSILQLNFSAGLILAFGS